MLRKFSPHLLGCLLLTLTACGSHLHVDPGTATVSRIVTSTLHPDGTLERREEVGGTSKGVGATASGDKADFKGDGAPAPFSTPTADTPGDVAPSHSPFTATVLTDSGSIWVRLFLALAGIAGIGGGAFLCYRGSLIIGGGTAGLGLGLLASAIFPAILLIVLGTAVLALATFLIYTVHTKKSVTEGLRALRAAVKTATPEVATAVETNLKDHAETGDMKVIRAIDTKDNL